MIGLRAIRARLWHNQWQNIRPSFAETSCVFLSKNICVGSSKRDDPGELARLTPLLVLRRRRSHRVQHQYKTNEFGDTNASRGFKLTACLGSCRPTNGIATESHLSICCRPDTPRRQLCQNHRDSLKPGMPVTSRTREGWLRPA